MLAGHYWCFGGFLCVTHSYTQFMAERGGLREWPGLDYLAGFVASCGISLWVVHNKTDRRSPV